MQELPDVTTVRTDFDQLALIADETWDHNNHYYPFLLKHIAQHCHEVLEIGCGIGELARLLTRRADHVLALDLAPEMVRRASELSEQYSNITFQVGDVQEQHFQTGRFDAILSVATIHHLPMEAMLRQMKEALAPGGTLAILDLYQAQAADVPVILLASPINFVLRPIKTGRLRRSKEAKAAWAAHSVHDHFLTLSQIRHVAEQILPGARITRHFFWRYSLLWTKPQ
jgi:2-polyprenyl-3-methyl-5-hydroxy-6-metoxy-1,4-benzoquinol methylase